VARWRADVDYVAAGIFCFQPYCVTGELDPPANPLIQPQFCLRFNDLDNIGLTGRHYSGFVMLGIQVFNKPEKFVFFKEECVEFNLRWLTEELEIDPDEITLIEDVWAGGGNLGPSIEYFINGLELGNMVFMQYKTFPDGRREPLEVQVIDVGIGLERVPWLVNGTPTSYCDVFPTPLAYLLDKIGMNINSGIWEKYGPYSCLLNVDEVDDISKTWAWIAEKIGQPVEEVRAAIEPIRDVYIVLDHTRSVLMAVEDGSLPSNVGGASNIRNILRRVFHVLHKNGWWEHLGMEGFLEIFAKHKEDLATVFGAFPAYKSFDEIIKIEYDRWLVTDDAQKTKLQKLMQKRGNKLLLEDWIIAVTSWGLPADKIGEISGQRVPDNLYYEIAQQQERSSKPVPTVLYNTSSLAPTDSLYYADHHQYEFDAKIIAAFPNVERNLEPSVIILNQSAFYPTSGGQEHDTGTLTINGVTHQVVDAIKVGPCVLHIISPPLPADAVLESYVGLSITGTIDQARRTQLRNHHTATHIVFASCRRVLGPHVWQHGAKKTTEKAHLDITHYRSLTYEEVRAIEREANKIVHSARDISKSFMPKDEAERQHGFHLYQGGVVPGNSLRVVHIDETDTEACCGTHCDNTSEVGLIRILKTGRISDGILRLYYVAGEKAVEKICEESDILHELCNAWDVTQKDLVDTASRFFDGYKRFSNTITKQTGQIMDLQMKSLLFNPSVKNAVVRTDVDGCTMYISALPAFAARLKAAGKSVVFVGDSFLYGLLGDAAALDVKALDAQVKQLDEENTKRAAEKAGAEAAKDAKKKKVEVISKNKLEIKDGKKKETVEGIVQFTCFNNPNPTAVVAFLTAQGFASLD
jgi:alanyl-tRNA synthetase